MDKATRYTLSIILMAGGVIGTLPLAAQEESENTSATTMEEVVVQGRLRSGADALVDQRIEDEVVTDYLGADMISRIGDSTVAAALRRVTGLSLVSGKFVYVRGLGERYSSTLLNGLSVPSPDLTRSVIPLDIFPTSIVQSLAVQKAYSADMPAEFGGGSVDIRTRGIPPEFTWSLEVGSGYNSETDGDVLTYNGGSDDDWGTDDGTRALPQGVADALATYRGDLSVASILDTERKRTGDADFSVDDARLINRQLATGLYRDISLEETSADPDINIKGSVGNNFFIDDDWEVGFLAGGSYKNYWRQDESTARNFRFPVERFQVEKETTHTVDMTGTLNTGVRFTEDHLVSTTSLYLRNTDDEAALIDFFNENRERSDGNGFRTARLKFEERDMTVHQVKGEHYLGQATREKFPFLQGLEALPNLNEIKFTWRYSEARAFTDIPSEIAVKQDTVTDPDTGQVLSSAVSVDSGTADYRFTELDDEVLNYGWDLAWPLYFGRAELELSGGYEYTRKVRTYEQRQFSLGALSVVDPSILTGSLASVFSDANILDPANDFVFDVTGSNAQSYMAVTMTDAAYGKFNFLWDDTWRISAGVRWEDYRQVAVDWNVVGYTLANPQVTMDPDRLRDGVFTDDDLYPSLALTWMHDGFWAETFQLRFGYSQTLVRPDLREITDAGYIDPITGATVIGKPGVVPSNVDSYDARAEWFFANGDNFTVSAFYKDIERPIEFFEAAASDTNTAREIVNAESGEVYGVEMEFLKGLDFIGDLGRSFFVSGNLTLQDSELIAGNEADAPTNQTRPLSNASEYVANVILGYDSFNAKHAATLSYNVFGERLSFAGRNGAPDGYEQPFHSLDFTYSWYPTDTVTLKFKLANMLQETITIERQNVVTFEEDPGTSVGLDFRWAF